ncbi:MAG: hypothetical protein WC332_02375 [Clostridia bacterium]|jgi:hypothetical protein
MITNSQSEAIMKFCDDVSNGDINRDWLKDHITINLDKTTMTVTIEIWDIDEQYFKDFV